MNRKLKNCDLVKQLILRKQLGNLTGEEVSKLNAHLEKCSECRLLQKKIDELPVVLAVPEEVNPLPRPEILQTLLRRFGDHGPMKRSVFYSSADSLLAILNRPVPLYQTAIAISLTVIISIYAFNIFSGNRSRVASMKQDVSLQVSGPEHNTYYYPSQYTLPLQVGVNAAEDTSFQSILFTAL